MHRLSLVLLSLSACAALVGCTKPEPPVYPVGGTVKFPDGKPAKACSVEFTSQAEATRGVQAHGEVAADGRFTLKTNLNGKLKDGAVAGPHKVIVAGGMDYSVTVPPRYTDADTSGLQFEVKPNDQNNYPITIERN
ncbi:MAG: hypothetical protein ACKODX_13500 [Gemmata sp.]|jgi:hypothetical protein